MNDRYEFLCISSTSVKAFNIDRIWSLPRTAFLVFAGLVFHLWHISSSWYILPEVFIRAFMYVSWARNIIIHIILCGQNIWELLCLQRRRCSSQFLLSTLIPGARPTGHVSKYHQHIASSGTTRVVSASRLSCLRVMIVRERDALGLHRSTAPSCEPSST